MAEINVVASSAAPVPVTAQVTPAISEFTMAKIEADKFGKLDLNAEMLPTISGAAAKFEESANGTVSMSTRWTCENWVHHSRSTVDSRSIPEVEATAHLLANIPNDVDGLSIGPRSIYSSLAVPRTVTLSTTNAHHEVRIWDFKVIDVPYTLPIADTDVVHSKTTLDISAPRNSAVVKEMGEVMRQTPPLVRSTCAAAIQLMAGNADFIGESFEAEPCGTLVKACLFWLVRNTHRFLRTPRRQIAINYATLADFRASHNVGRVLFVREALPDITATLLAIGTINWNDIVWLTAEGMARKPVFTAYRDVNCLDDYNTTLTVVGNHVSVTGQVIDCAWLIPRRIEDLINHMRNLVGEGMMADCMRAAVQINTAYGVCRDIILHGDPHAGLEIHVLGQQIDEDDDPLDGASDVCDSLRTVALPAESDGTLRRMGIATTRTRLGHIDHITLIGYEGWASDTVQTRQWLAEAQTRIARQIFTTQANNNAATGHIRDVKMENGLLTAGSEAASYTCHRVPAAGTQRVFTGRPITVPRHLATRAGAGAMAAMTDNQIMQQLTPADAQVYNANPQRFCLIRINWNGTLYAFVAEVGAPFWLTQSPGTPALNNELTHDDQRLINDTMELLMGSSFEAGIMPAWQGAQPFVNDVPLGGYPEGDRGALVGPAAENAQEPLPLALQPEVEPERAARNAAEVTAQRRRRAVESRRLFIQGTGVNEPNVITKVVGTERMRHRRAYFDVFGRNITKPAVRMPSGDLQAVFFILDRSCTVKSSTFESNESARVWWKRFSDPMHHVSMVRSLGAGTHNSFVTLHNVIREVDLTQGELGSDVYIAPLAGMIPHQVRSAVWPVALKTRDTWGRYIYSYEPPQSEHSTDALALCRGVQQLLTASTSYKIGSVIVASATDGLLRRNLLTRGVNDSMGYAPRCAGAIGVISVRYGGGSLLPTYMQYNQHFHLQFPRLADGEVPEMNAVGVPQIVRLKAPRFQCLKTIGGYPMRYRNRVGIIKTTKAVSSDPNSVSDSRLPTERSWVCH
eukprot:GHVU01106295.1.p1 GENE.GHVU01106295.1~~GHVU01106295.1.p1  ORF type:complete len:1026 (+),score=101.79 GHVU01106295.1:122-3199(+)